MDETDVEDGVEREVARINADYIAKGKRLVTKVERGMIRMRIRDELTAFHYPEIPDVP